MLWILYTMMLAFGNGDAELANTKTSMTHATAIVQAEISEHGQNIPINVAQASCDASGGSIQWFSWLAVLTLIAVSRERTPEARRRLSRVRIKQDSNYK